MIEEHQNAKRKWDGKCWIQKCVGCGEEVERAMIQASPRCFPCKVAILRNRYHDAKHAKKKRG